MKTIFLLIVFLVSAALQAQTTSLTPPVTRKNNFKIRAVDMGEGFLSTPFNSGIDGFHSYSFQYERFLKGRHTFTATPSYSVSKYNFSNGYLASRGFSLSLGYRYYLYQWKKNKPFNGVYGGVSINGSNSVSSEYINAERVYNIVYNKLGSSLQLGVQTTFLKRFTAEMEGSYGISRYHYSHYYSNQQGFVMSLRLGFTF
jgi:hypothetical protein